MTRLSPLPLPPLPGRPLVSVLVSCYNYGAFVGDAVRSALAQTCGPVEVVVVDDGSTDGSGDVVERQFGGDARVRLVRQENAGQAAAMNVALDAARGDVLCFLDADDVFTPDKCARTVKALRDRPDAGFLVHGFTVVDGRGRVLATRTGLPEPGWHGEAVLQRGGGIPAAPPTSALALRRPVAEALFPIDPAWRIATDTVLQRTAPLLTAIAVVPEPLMRYRVHGANHFGEVDGSVAGIERMIRVTEAAHDHQRAFLRDRFGSEVADRLAPLHDDPSWLWLRAQRDYLGGSPAAFRTAVRQLAAHPGSAQGRDGALARFAAAAPTRLGRAAWGAVHGSGLHKRVLRAVRSASSKP